MLGRRRMKGRSAIIVPRRKLKCLLKLIKFRKTFGPTMRPRRREGLEINTIMTAAYKMDRRGIRSSKPNVCRTAVVTIED
mmetsp:Transcript_23833/g.49651  ORF Transcript_23833/g.49651 Transcript_23833/m.49651 type:complete len:80 (+) Transcript_23833:1189-1428(+)